MLFVKAGAEAFAVEINASNHALKYGQGHAQQRADVRFRKTLDLAQLVIAGDIAAQNRNSLLQYLAGNSAAYFDQLTLPSLPHAGKHGIELVAFPVRQQDSASARGSDFKNKIQQLFLQFVEIANRMNDA